MTARLGYVAAAVLVIGLWLPWATLSIGLFGSDAGTLGNLNGQQIGSDLLDLPVGWIAAAAGAVGFLALRSRSRGLAVAAGIVAVLVAGYTLVSIPGKESTTANGQDVSNLIAGQVDFAWGVFAVAAAAVVLLVAGLRMTRDLDEDLDDVGVADA